MDAVYGVFSMINYIEKGAGVHEAINRAGYTLEEEFINGIGRWVSSNDAAVQSIIDNYTLSDAKNYLIRVLYEHAGELRNQALEGISVGEMTGWTSKKLDSEKYKVKKNSVDAPMLARIAAAAGITIDELVAQIDANATALLNFEADVSGIAIKHSKAIKTKATFADLLSYDWKAGWPSASISLQR